MYCATVMMQKKKKKKYFWGNYLSLTLSLYICILDLLRIYCKTLAYAIYSNLFHFLVGLGW